uniref:Uncharacterized protein n=1 Tax=Parascaris univalens TaxID=6257 RepID=A0A915C9Q4_PARUN
MSLVDNFRLDQEILLNAANRVQRLKMFPYFDIAHYILMTIAVRDDLASGAAIFSRKHPLSCWLSSMLMCFAGSFLANFLLGEPVIAPFKRHDDILVATAIWYLVFYSPFDIVYKTSKFYPLRSSCAFSKKYSEPIRLHMAFPTRLNSIQIHIWYMC